MTFSPLHRFAGMASLPPLLPLSMAIGMTMSASVYAASPNSINANNTANNSQQTTTAAPTANNTNTDGIIALVNDNTILKSDLINAIEQTRQRAMAMGQPLPDARRLQAEVLNALIMRELQLSLINRMGLKPEETVINNRLAQIAQAQGFASLKEFQQQLDANKMGSYAALRQRITEDTAIQALQQRQIANRVRITTQDIDAFLASPEAKRLNQSEYQTIHVRVPYIDDYNRLSDTQRAQALTVAQRLHTKLNAPSIDITEILNEAQKDYPLPLQGGNMGYHKAASLPTELASAITALKVGEVSQPMVTPEGIDIVKLADQRHDESLIVPQWYTRHILVKVDDSQPEELAEQKINDLYEQLRQGANFAELAATYSDDLGSAGRKGDLDWVSEGEMVPAFEKMMKQTPIGDFSTPFRTQFGWHILQVVEKREEDVSEQYQRNLARDALYQRMAPQAKEDWLQELRAGAYVKILE